MRDLTTTSNHDAPSHKCDPDKNSRPLRRRLARATLGTSPVAVMSMAGDWAMHLATAPDKQLSLMQKAQDNWMDWLAFVTQGCPDDTAARPISPKRGDRRFTNPAWANPPFAALAQGFLLAEDFVDHATSDIPGLDPSDDKAMTFLARQFMDAAAPSNFFPTNPEAIARTIETRGQNLAHGAAAFMRGWQEKVSGDKPVSSKVVGRDVATTPGKVVYRNHLIELIQYTPTTSKVQAEPILIVPAWIMKYYILDLSPENSIVRYLVAQGFTVFMISWRNPGAEDADLGMADYLQQGPMAAVEHITKTTGAAKLHAAGYCLGGTVLSIAAATMARDGDERLASMTLLAAQTDFSDAGELMLFINESQVSFLEDVMAAQGYLEAEQMMSAFQMLRSNDLIWSRMIRTYLLGEDDAPMNDLMAWNADSTRMPARMHSEYLRKMFLNNDLASGRYQVEGHAVSLRDIRVPVFGVGTETDHIAPWTSVFKIHNLAHADVSFVLTNGGHNAGVVSEPGHPRRHFRLHTTRDQDRALSPEDWLKVTNPIDGSWWPEWTKWLTLHSGQKVAPPKISGAITEAPGTYVMME